MNNKPKVLYLTNIPSPYRVNYFKELSKFCDLTVVFEQKQSGERNNIWNMYNTNGFRAVFLRGIRWKTDSSICPTVISYIKQEYEHIIVTNFSDPTGILSILYLKSRKIKYQIEGDGGFPKSGNGLKERFKKWLLTGAEIYFSTAKMHDLYYYKYGAIPEKVMRYPFSSVFEHNIIEKPLSANEKKIIKKRIGIIENHCVLAVGQFIHRKGFDLLISAAKTLPNSIGFYFVGGYPTDEYLLLSQGMNNIHFVGFKTSEELSEYYKASDLFVLPTREDIWGLVINEAMAYGLPIITTDKCVAGLEMVDDDNGKIIPTNSLYHISYEINRIINSQELRKKMSATSIRRIKKYTIENMVKVHLVVWKETV